MPPRVLFDDLDHWKCFSTGYWLDLQEPTSPVRHPFCGVHEIRGAHCFHGDHPVLRFLSLDTSDSQLGLQDLGVPWVHLLYCWRCDVGDFDYRLEPDGGVTILGEKEWFERLRQLGRDPEEVRARLRDPDTDYPYSNYPAAFPLRAATVRPLAAGEQEAILGWEQDNDNELPETLDHPRHQVGGLPYLSQGSSYVPTCADCGQRMAFAASIADECGDPRGFTSNEYVQVVFFVCPACRRVHATNMVD